MPGMISRKVKIDASFTAKSKDELLNYLKNQITSLLSYKKKTKRQREELSFYMFLATWATADNLSYPLAWNPQDKPDFCLSQGKQYIGIEHTDAVDENEEAIFALAEQEGKRVMVASDEFGPNAPSLNAKQKREIINRPHRITTVGFGDDGMERYWSYWMLKTIGGKTVDFQKPDFKKYNENWLLIYDGLPLRFANTQRSVNFLLSEILSYWTQDSRYGRIFIQRPDGLVDIRPNVWRVHPLIGI